MNFYFLEQIPKVVYLFNPQKLNTLFGHRWNLPSPSLDVRGRPSNQAIPITDLSDYDPDWSYYPTLRFGTLRDAQYLRERYLRYPFLKYYIFLEGSSDSPSLCVARVIKTTSGITVGRILEFQHPESESGERAGEQLISGVLEFLRLRGCDYADFYSTGWRYIKTLESIGFIQDQLGVLPSLLDPIDFSRQYQNLEVFVSGTLRAKHPDCREQLFVTRADGDQDRPNASFTLAPE
jgi:hypothetical protein